MDNGTIVRHLYRGLNRLRRRKAPADVHMSSSREAVTWGYRLFLDREPESQQVLDEKTRRFTSTGALREELIQSEEFQKKNRGALSGDEPGMLVESVESEADLQLLFRHIQDAWQHLGETEPHWSVLASEQFRRANIESTRDLFYSTGRHNVEQLFRTLDRNGVDYASFRSCLDYGCGLGRVTYWLAERFETVFAYDISRAHLLGAEDHLTRAGVRNVTFNHVRQLQDLQNLPRVDLVYSVIVLQHNPPPIIGQIIRQFVRALNPGGVAFFQVPTFRLGYRFSLQEYLSGEGAGREMEMHLLPQRTVFDIVAREGGKLLEVMEDSWSGARQKEMSNTFLVQKEQGSGEPPD